MGCFCLLNRQRKPLILIIPIQNLKHGQKLCIEEQRLSMSGGLGQRSFEIVFCGYPKHTTKLEWYIIPLTSQPNLRAPKNSLICIQVAVCPKIRLSISAQPNQALGVGPNTATLWFLIVFHGHRRWYSDSKLVQAQKPCIINSIFFFQVFVVS